MPTPRVAIVYLAYNSRPYLKDVVLSVEQLNYPKERIEFIIVDNASPDNSAEMIQELVLPKSGQTLPRVTFFPNQHNEGFAGGNNLGINHALLDGVDYVYLLNNDAKFHPDALKEAVDLAKTDSQIGSVQSLMLLWQKENTVNSSGNKVHFLGFGYTNDNGEDSRLIQTKDCEEIFYASGAAVLYRASTLRQVGVLDPYLFLYHEDLELGWRIRLAGFRNVLSKHSIVYHHYEFTRSIKKYFWMERNRLLVHLSHLKAATLVLLLPLMCLLELFLIVLAVKGGWIKEKMLVYAELFHPNTWKYLKKKRRESVILRQVSDREIARLFVSKIKHQETKSKLVDFGNIGLTIIWKVLRLLIRW
ncbi:glycosyltransferase family 2 protein [Patescibacteria group bacterium]